MSSYSEGQTHLLMDRFEAEGFTKEEITRLGQHSKLSLLRDWLNGRASIVINNEQDAPSTTTYPVEIDYNDTFEQRLGAGRYDWKNPHIKEKNFPVKSKGKVNRVLELVHFGKFMSTEAVLAAIDAQGYRPATIEELLAFGAKYPELQREFPIVELGSVWRDWDDDLSVAYLVRDGSRRNLGLGRVEDGWYGRFRFLVVGK